MAIPSRLMGVGCSAAQSVNICGDVVDSITAAGTTNADATQLSAAINRVTTTALNTGVRLMLPEQGSQVVVVNSGANALLVYPGTGAADQRSDCNYRRLLRCCWWSRSVRWN